MEPHLDRVELGRIGGQIHHLYSPFLSKLHRLFFVVNGAVIHYQPFLTVLVLFELIELFKQLSNEVQILVLSVGSFDDPPVCEAFFSDDSYQ